MAGKCAFFQSVNYTLDEQNCLQEIKQQKSEAVQQGATVEAICVDIKINLEKKIDVTDCCLSFR
jgi:hypothetical protein